MARPARPEGRVVEVGHGFECQRSGAMRLNKSTGDAIRILIACARAEGALVKVVDLSASLDITMQNVFKIVHILSRAGLTAAVRGRHGGIRLSRPADTIFIGDVVRAMESTEPTSDASAGVTRVIDDALEAFIAVLDRHSLADMVAREAANASSRAKPSRRSAQAAAKSRGKSSRKPLQTAAARTVRGHRPGRSSPPKA
ncbi:MAG: RrF2 family transcriptional regulator [Hyphomicrobiaceae bacterium]